MNYSGAITSNKFNEVNNDFYEDKDDTQNITENSTEYEDNDEIGCIMNLMQETRNENEELFMFIMLKNKEIMEIIQNHQRGVKEDIFKLDSLFQEVEEYDRNFLFWCVHKGIKIALINKKDIDLTHFFLVKKGYKLTNKTIYKSLLNVLFHQISTRV